MCLHTYTRVYSKYIQLPLILPMPSTINRSIYTYAMEHTCTYNLHSKNGSNSTATIFQGNVQRNSKETLPSQDRFLLKYLILARAKYSPGIPAGK